MKVGFIGVGNMGWPMAGHIAKAGHQVVAFDLDKARCEKFAAEHGAKAGSLAEVAACEVVITMLPTSKHVRAALTEADGGAFIKALKPGTVIVDMSSSEPGDSREMGPIIAKTGAVFLDGPVSGAVPRAITGDLAIMLGGDDAAAKEKAKPILSCMGKKIFETGPLGSGHAMKALNNSVGAAGLAAAAEALSVGKRFGLDPAVMVDILNVSTGKNFATEVVIPSQVLTRKFAGGFAVGLMAKDVKIAADLAKQMGMEAPVAQLVSQRWIEARDTLGADKDASESVLAWDPEF